MTFAGIPVPWTTREEWLKLRRDGIGASDVAAIVGLSPWAGPWHVWADKTGALETEETEPMLWGRLLEDAVIDEWSRREGRDVIFRSGLFRHVSEPWMMCTVDGLAVPRGATELAEVEAVVEVKLDSSRGWPDGPPPHYLCQVQWQMAVLGVPEARIVVLHQGRRLDVHEVAADPDDQRALADAARRFWVNHVEAGVVPPVDGSTTQVAARVWAEDDGETVEVDADVVAELARVREEIAALEARRDVLEGQLKASLGSAAVGAVGGEPVVTWRTQTRRQVDVRRLRAVRPDVAEEFMVERTSRVFRLAKRGDRDG